MAIPSTIDTLKSSISRRGGLARSNRFAVYLTHPSKKTSFLNTDLSSLLGNAARSVIQTGKLPGAKTFFEDPRDVYLFCESVSLPGRQVATNDFYTGMKNIKKPYAYLNDDVTMTFNLTNDYYMYDYFKTWVDAIFPRNGDYRGIAYKKDYCTNLVIQQLGNNDWVPVKSIVLRNAYPVTVSSVNLSNSNENSVSQITVTFAFDDWEEQGIVAATAQPLTTGLSAITNSINKVRNIGKVLGL